MLDTTSRTLLPLTYDLDLDIGGVLSSLVLQDYLVVACVLSLSDVNGQTGVVSKRLCSHPVSRVQNHLQEGTMPMDNTHAEKNKQEEDSLLGEHIHSIRAF